MCQVMGACEGLIEGFKLQARGAMRILLRLLVASLLASAGVGQPCSAESVNNIRIGKLVIESNSLAGADRERIIRLFQQKMYCQPEIGERIRGALRDLGYFKADRDEPRFSFPVQGDVARDRPVPVREKQGGLDVEGVEAHRGGGKVLLNWWKTSEGKRYNPVELQHWLLANHVDWKVGTQISDSMRMAQEPESLVVNVKLTQWPD